MCELLLTLLPFLGRSVAGGVLEQLTKPKN